MLSHRILLIEDDPKMRNAIASILKKQGYDVTAVADGETGLEKLGQFSPDLAIIDLKLPGIDGLEVLRRLKGNDRDISAIMVTAYATIDSAVEAMKEGAEDYIPKPFNIEEIRLVVEKVLDKHELRLKNKYLQDQLGEKYDFSNIIGESKALKTVLETVSKVAESNTTILIYGETGTGKELVARAIHFNSYRAGNVFLPVNCGALSENLLESELFGHEKGAFTGAVSEKRGLFEVASGGTLFLDEIGDVSPGLQQKLLRTLEQGEIQPVGSTKMKKVDVRIIAATNRNLQKLVRDGEFREDLFYRLSIIPIKLPPLRERRGDIRLLALNFLEEFCRENHKEINSIQSETMKILESYPWPGNVRELRNVIEHAVLLESESNLTPDFLPEHLVADRDPDQQKIDDLKTLEEVSKNYISEILKKTSGNKTKASEILGINRTSLWRMMQRLNIRED